MQIRSRYFMQRFMCIFQKNRHTYMLHDKEAIYFFLSAFCGFLMMPQSNCELI